MPFHFLELMNKIWCLCLITTPPSGFRLPPTLTQGRLLGHLHIKLRQGRIPQSMQNEVKHCISSRRSLAYHQFRRNCISSTRKRCIFRTAPIRHFACEQREQLYLLFDFSNRGRSRVLLEYNFFPPYHVLLIAIPLSRTVNKKRCFSIFSSIYRTN